MRYRVYGVEGVSREPRAPLELETDSEEAARLQAKEMGMAVVQVEPIRPPGRPPSLWRRWLYGLVLSIEACILLGIAWQLPAFVGESVIDRQNVPGWLQTALVALWAVAMILFCPLAFEWMARTFWSSLLADGGRDQHNNR
jgi:hypothetical protein